MCFRGWKVIVLLSPSFTYQFPVRIGQFQEFSQLLKDLDNATFRSAFCARSTAGTSGTSGTASAKADQWVGRKIDLKVGRDMVGDMVGRTAQTSDEERTRLFILFCRVRIFWTNRWEGWTTRRRRCFWIGMFTQDPQQICFVDFV